MLYFVSRLFAEKGKVSLYREDVFAGVPQCGHCSMGAPTRPLDVLLFREVRKRGDTLTSVQSLFIDNTNVTQRPEGTLLSDWTRVYTKPRHRLSLIQNFLTKTESTDLASFCGFTELASFCGSNHELALFCGSTDLASFCGTTEFASFFSFTQSSGKCTFLCTHISCHICHL